MKIEQNKSMFKHFKNISRNIFGKYLKGWGEANVWNHIGN
jgi:hypothetical protein